MSSEEEDQILIDAVEECSELIQIICKVKKFGWMNWHPEDELKIPNIFRLLEESSQVKTKVNALLDLAESKISNIKLKIPEELSDE